MKDGTINVKKKIELCSLPPCRKALIQHIRRANFQMAIWRRTDTPLIASRKPTDGHGWHADDDGSMIPLWFAGDCLPKVLIDNEDLLNFEESDDDDDDDDEDDDDVVGKDDVAYDDSDDDD